MLIRFLSRISNGAGVRARAVGHVRFSAAVIAFLLLTTQSALPCFAEDEDSQIKAVLDQYYDSQFEKAKKLCDALLAEHPKNLTAHYLLGNICVKLHQVAEAEAAYKFCLRGGKDSSEATYAYQALEQLYEQRRMVSSPVGSPTNSPAPTRPTVGTNHSSEEHIQEETDRLQKDAQDKIAVKQRTLDDRIQQEQRGMQEQLTYAPRGRRAGYYRQEFQAQVKADYQDRVDRLKKEFEREKDEINQACQKRIDDLSEYEHNTENRRSNR